MKTNDGPWITNHIWAKVPTMKDDAQLYKEFRDNDGFRRWLSDTIFGIVTDGDDRPAV